MEDNYYKKGKDPFTKLLGGPESLAKGKSRAKTQLNKHNSLKTNYHELG